jgi:hypothetical protein
MTDQRFLTSAIEHRCAQTEGLLNSSNSLIITIISPLQSTAIHRPLQLLAISLDLRLLATSFYQPSCVNRHSTWPEFLHYVYRDAVSTPELQLSYELVYPKTGQSEVFDTTDYRYRDVIVLLHSGHMRIVKGSFDTRS